MAPSSRAPCHLPPQHCAWVWYVHPSERTLSECFGRGAVLQRIDMMFSGNKRRPECWGPKEIPGLCGFGARAEGSEGGSRREWGGGVWHNASVSDCLPLAAHIGLSPLLILTLCGPEHVLVVSTEPLDDLSCLTIPGSAVPETGYCPCRQRGASICTLRVHVGLADSSTDLSALGCASTG